jgi:predicted component of type VI protein secretion system
MNRLWLFARIPDGKRKHSVEARETFPPPLDVSVDDDFGVGFGFEAMAERFKLAAQLLEVVDLTVVGQPDRARSVRHRFVAGRREVDDREAAVSKRHAVTAGRLGDVDALVVGPAMLDSREH